MTEPSTGTSQIVGRQLRHADALGGFLHNVPNRLHRHAISPSWDRCATYKCRIPSRVGSDNHLSHRSKIEWKRHYKAYREHWKTSLILVVRCLRCAFLPGPTHYQPSHHAAACMNATAHPQRGRHRTTSHTWRSVRSPGTCILHRQARRPDTTVPGPRSGLLFLPATRHTSCCYSTLVGLHQEAVVNVLLQ